MVPSTGLEPVHPQRITRLKLVVSANFTKRAYGGELRSQTVNIIFSILLPTYPTATSLQICDIMPIMQTSCSKLYILSLQFPINGACSRSCTYTLSHHLLRAKCLLFPPYRQLFKIYMEEG